MKIQDKAKHPVNLTSSYPQTMARFDSDWKKVCSSGQTIKELMLLAASHKQLNKLRPTEILKMMGGTRNISYNQRDPIILGLYDFIDEVPLAGRLILQSLRPQIGFLHRATFFADNEERASTIFSIAAEEVMRWRPEKSEFCHLGLYRSIFKYTMRFAKKWTRYEQLDFDISAPETEAANFMSLKEWAGWVEDLAKVDPQTALMIVLTRSDYMTLEQYSAETGISVTTLRQRRLRAESKMKRCLKGKQ